MITDVIYSEDEKVVREYNVFKGNGKRAEQKGVNIIFTNKRIVVKTYNSDIFNKQLNIREALIENLSGDINISSNIKISLIKLIMFIVLTIISFGFTFGEKLFEGSPIVFGLLAVLFIVAIVMMFKFPETEGKIAIYNKNALKDGIFVSGGNILKAKEEVVKIIDIQKGEDFDICQEEIGYLLMEIKNGVDVDKLITNLNNKEKSNSQNNDTKKRKPQNIKQNYYDNDEEIPLI